MMDNNKTKEIELRSEEVQELMGSISPIIVRVGILVFTLFLVLAIVFSAIIKYSEIITIPANARNIHWMIDVTNQIEGQMININFARKQVNSGDTICTLLSSFSHDTIYIRAPQSGLAIPSDLFRKDDYINDNICLFHIVDSVSQTVYAKAYIDQRTKIALSNKAEMTTTVNGHLVKGKVISISDNPNPNENVYPVLFSFDLPSDYSKCVIWQKDISVNINISDKTIFEKFVLSKFQINP